MTKYIFCTGGVVSGVGKGVTLASIGRILKARGIKVAIQKLDPYLNVDPGTMSPYQHGEVFVTADGAETDLDLGHYERFIDEEVHAGGNVTTGQVYSDIIAKERRGDFLGGTIQVIPHITSEIKRRIKLIAKETGADVLLVEVGGTVGDIESQPFIEALRQLRAEMDRDDTVSIHVTYLPYIGASHELKTKPTQHSVRDLRSMGIQPQVIVARSDHSVSQDIINKIALFCDVPPEGVVALETVRSIYEVPILLEDAGLGDYIVNLLKLKSKKPDLARWRKMVDQIHNADKEVKVAIVGKYVELHDAYMSVKEALLHAAVAHNHKVDILWVNSAELEKGRGMELLEQAQGIVVPGGFGERGVEGKIIAARYARSKDIPYLGLCLGMQVMCIEYARNVLGHEDANSTEFTLSSEYPIIDLMHDQRGISDMGGTMRLGHYPCNLIPGTKAAQAYGASQIMERHRHRWEVNNAYRNEMETGGMCFSGLSPDSKLVEIAEVKDHPFMLGSQFHPEFASRPDRPHPLFNAFMEAIIQEGKNKNGR